MPKDLVAPVGFSLILTTLFAFNYMSSGHEPVAQDMPVGVVGSPALAEAAQGDLFSLELITYDDQDAATQAMARAEIYGAPGHTRRQGRPTIGEHPRAEGHPGRVEPGRTTPVPRVKHH